MARMLGTWRCFLLSVWIMVILQSQRTRAEVRVLCAMVKDWFPSGVKAQSSRPPYELNVTRPDGRSVYEDMYGNEPHYGPDQGTYTISLNGTRTGNTTETFIGFMIYVYNEFNDEESGDILSPLPAGVFKRGCHFKGTSQYIEVLQNSTNSNQWQSLLIKWRSPRKYPAGKITISASVVKEDGIYWEGITVTLNYECPVFKCVAQHCPRGYAKTKFGCQTCDCAGAASISVGFASLLVIMLSLFCNLI